MSNKRKIRIQIDQTPEQLDLCKKMGSKNKTESMAAAEAVAAIMTQPILQVIEQANTVANFFTTIGYSAGTPSNLLLDDYFDIRQQNFLNVWTQSQPGGTAMNFVQGATELFVQTYPLYTEITFNKNYLAAGQLNHLANGLTRLVQEVLLLQQTNGAFVIFNSMAGARIDGNSANTATSNLPVMRSTTANVFQMDDFNNMLIGYDRTTASWVGGTPVNEDREITDILGSPEWMGQIRSMAYQPQNTRAGSVATQGATALSAPDSVRETAWRGGGVPTLFDKSLHKVYEMGVGTNRQFNNIFASAAGATAYPGYGQGFGGGTTSAFAPTTEEVVLGLNANMFDLARLRMNEEGSELSLTAEEYPVREQKVGFFGGLREGYISVEGRAKFSVIV